MHVDAFDVFPDHVARGIVERGEIEERRDVGMLNARREPGLAQKTLMRAGLARDIRAHQLDDSYRVEMQMEDFVDLPHPAHPEARQDLVFAVDGGLEVAAQKIGDRFAAM